MVLGRSQSETDGQGGRRKSFKERFVSSFRVKRRVNSYPPNSRNPNTDLTKRNYSGSLSFLLCSYPKRSGRRQEPKETDDVFCNEEENIYCPYEKIVEESEEVEIVVDETCIIQLLNEMINTVITDEMADDSENEDYVDIEEIVTNSSTMTMNKTDSNCIDADDNNDNNDQSNIKKDNDCDTTNNDHKYNHNHNNKNYNNNNNNNNDDNNNHKNNNVGHNNNNNNNRKNNNDNNNDINSNNSNNNDDDDDEDDDNSNNHISNNNNNNTKINNSNKIDVGKDEEEGKNVNNRNISNSSEITVYVQASPKESKKSGENKKSSPVMVSTASTTIPKSAANRPITSTPLYSESIISSYNVKTRHFLSKLFNIKKAFSKSKSPTILDGKDNSACGSTDVLVRKDLKGEGSYEIRKSKDNSSYIITFNDEGNEQRSSVRLSMKDSFNRSKASQFIPSKDKSRSSSSSSLNFSCGLNEDEMDLSYLIDYANQAFEDRKYNMGSSTDTTATGLEGSVGDIEVTIENFKDHNGSARGVLGGSGGSILDNHRDSMISGSEEDESGNESDISKSLELLENTRDAMTGNQGNVSDRKWNIKGGSAGNILENDYAVPRRLLNREGMCRSLDLVSTQPRESLCESLHLGDMDDEDVVIAEGPDLIL